MFVDYFWLGNYFSDAYWVDNFWFGAQLVFSSTARVQAHVVL